MKAPLYIEILRETLLPFLQSTCPDRYRFMQDNDPKYTSRVARQFLQDHNVNWWMMHTNARPDVDFDRMFGPKLVTRDEY